MYGTGTGTTGGDQEVAKKTHLGFRPLADVVGPLRLRSSGALGICNVPGLETIEG
jgi:hypothetical protein